MPSMETKNASLSTRKTPVVPLTYTVILLWLSVPASGSSYHASITGGMWIRLQESIGISAMHMQLLPNNKVVIFDRTDFGSSNLSLLPFLPCRFNDDVVKPFDCTAHSILYDVATNAFRPLNILTNTFCSSGALDPFGTLVQTGGDRRGDRIIRNFYPCDYCDWIELNSTRLYNRRWYATNQILPDGRVIIVGGRRVFTYEFFPKITRSLDNFTLPFLVMTRDPQEENNLYPFLHLLPDGSLFIFAGNRSIQFNYSANRVLREFPQMPGPDRRNYPSTGSSVLLPLIMPPPGELMKEPEVMICGGAPAGSYLKATYLKKYEEASRTCGRLKVFDPSPGWIMEEMPSPRVMSDMLLLPTGDVVFINGARNGTAGWNNAIDPILTPVIYLPEEDDPTKRFVVLNPTTIPRMYHSTAALMPDGSILVGGSNPHPTYNFTGFPYPTELSIEAFLPHYMDPRYRLLKPTILSVKHMVFYNATFAVNFLLPVRWPDDSLEGTVSIVLVSPSFTTHSVSMNQRAVFLRVVGLTPLSPLTYKVIALGPVNANVAPPGYYMLFVVHAGIPGHSVWARVM